jgi:aminoglycoside 2''-phosphotransferase
VFYASGIEVEYGITTRDWLNTNPMDEGTQKVLNDGYRLLDDKVGLFSTYFANQGLMAPPNAEALASRVTAEFPGLHFSDVHFVNSGVDHAVLILDSTWVFRFPRTAEYRVSLTRELNLLKQLQARSPVAVPHYEHISRAQDFGGYRIIEGEELRTALFQSLAGTAQEKIMFQVVDFMSALHALPQHLLMPTTNSLLWDCDRVQRHVNRYFKLRRDTIAANVPPRMLPVIDEFYHRYAEIRVSRQAITHADLTDDHILVTPSGSVGIIDFADAVVADPAHDFAYFWSYGDWVPKAMYERYELNDDEDFLTRSHWHFVRYRIDCFYSDLKDRLFERAEATAIEIERHLRNIL